MNSILPTNIPRLSVLLCTQGTYPFSSGGVSTWCDILCKLLPQVDFTIYALTGIPQTESLYTFPENVRDVVAIPMWGMQEPAEFIRTDMTFFDLRKRKRSTTSDAIEHVFVPNLRRLLRGLYAAEPALNDCGESLYNIWRYFQRYDWNTTWKSKLTWDAFTEETLLPYTNGTELFESVPTLFDLTNGLRSLHHHLMILNAPVPECDIVHSTLSGFAGIPGIIAKHKYGTPLIITEHGIFVREQYMSIASDTNLSPFTKRFMIGLSNLVCKMLYHYADVISPVCEYNSRWELQYGVESSKIHCIHNSVDAHFFVPAPKPEETAHRPTVVASARVFPLKDLETMIRSAAVARKRIPDVQYIVFGSTSDEPEYFLRCCTLVEELGLQATFRFAGLHPRSALMYTKGDVSVLSSVSEAFPYAVLESMSCERPVVATDVGSIRDVLEGFGIVVPPRDPVALGNAVADLLLDEPRRVELGKKARQEVLDKYQSHTTIDAYWRLYQRLHYGPRTLKEAESLQLTAKAVA